MFYLITVKNNMSMGKPKPFRDRLVISTMEDALAEKSKSVISVPLPFAEQPESPPPKPVPITHKSAKARKKTDDEAVTTSRTTSKRASKAQQKKLLSDKPKFKKPQSKDIPDNKKQTKVSDYFQSVQWQFLVNSNYLPDLPPVDPVSNRNRIDDTRFWNNDGPVLSSSPLRQSVERIEEYSIILLSSNDDVVYISESSDY